jgi:hypothetical protein
MFESTYLFCNNPACLVYQRMNTFKSEWMSAAHIFIILSRNTCNTGVLFIETSVKCIRGLHQKSWQLIFLGKHVTVRKVQNILMKGHDIPLPLA